MKLSEALEIAHRPVADDAPSFTVGLACGCEPLHLKTFLTAELRQRLPERRVAVTTGVFDDLPGNVERATRLQADAVAVVIEWSDLDPRLGLRRLGGWRTEDLEDLVGEAELSLERLERRLVSAADGRRVVCLLPTLPLPPLFTSVPAQSSAPELALRGAVATCGARLAAHAGITVAGRQRLDELSPAADRRDVKGELHAGFPYTLGHASAVASLLSGLLWPPAPKKGLITDLDDTLWAGLLGEIGADHVSWTGDAHRHGLYQQLLGSLASAGVLIGVASRNDPGLVAEALRRNDLLIPTDAMFPVHAGWGAKSDSVGRILATWNVAADAVVFVDDSRLELDAARDAFPGLETMAPPRDDDGIWRFLTDLRALFGRPGVGDEDRLRLGSIRAGAAFHRAQAAGSEPDAFLARVGGVVEFSRNGARPDRALELINKTSQFNLNGRRMGGAEVGRAASLGHLVTVGYSDRYGPLGMVAALLVSPRDGGVHVDAWAMSCRAFARRVEHHTLSYLFDTFAAGEITFTFRQTERNLALTEFLTSILGAAPGQTATLARAAFQERAPALVHGVTES